jgi:7,8-dihydro-6-hydroxymethylpterin-pyrophosphokinase
MQKLGEEFTDIKRSALYESNDFSSDTELKYWNLAVGFHCSLSYSNLIARLKHIERSCGRHQPGSLSHQVPIDLDLVFLLAKGSLDAEVEHCLDYSFIVRTSYFIGPLANLYPSWVHPDAQTDLLMTLKNIEELSPKLEEISDVF